MTLINTIDEQTFSLNGINYTKNFVAIRTGEQSLMIVNLYDTKFQLLKPTAFNEISLNGVVHTSLINLMNAITTVLYFKKSLQDLPFLGSITPSSVIPADIDVYGVATQSGTYANCGGLVVSVNSIAVISRVSGIWTISEDEIALGEYLKIVNIADNLASSTSNQALSAKQGNILDNKKADKVDIVNVNFIKRDSAYSADEVSVINAIEYVKIYNANLLRKYIIMFVSANDSTNKYNIRIGDKLTGVSSIINIPTLSTVNGIGVLDLNVILGTDEPVNIKLAIDYSKLDNRVYMNRGHLQSNLVLSKQTYVDVAPSDIQELNDEVNQLDTEVKSSLIKLNELYIKQPNVSWTLGYWNVNGALAQASNYCHSNYFNVNTGTLVTTTGLAGVGGAAAAKIMVFFDINYNFITYSDNLSVIVDSSLSSEFEDIAYVSFSHNNINNTSSIVITINVNTEIEKLNIRTTTLENNILSTKNKTLAVLGDSIMMLMRTGSYTTQQQLDNQNWENLKSQLNLTDLINLGLGGSTIMEKTNITDMPQADDNITNCISNQARWLKRLTTAGRSVPNIILIAAGTNGAGEPSSDNYDEIMSLDWSVLSDDVSGLPYRKTFYGGLRYTLEFLYRNYPLATICVQSPIQTNPNNYRTYTALSSTKNGLEKMAKRYSCLFFDALNESGVVDLFETSSGTGNWLSDGLHLKSNGKILLTNYVSKKIKTNYFNKTT